MEHASGSVVSCGGGADAGQQPRARRQHRPHREDPVALPLTRRFRRHGARQVCDETTGFFNKAIIYLLSFITFIVYTYYTGRDCTGNILYLLFYLLCVIHIGELRVLA